MRVTRTLDPKRPPGTAQIGFSTLPILGALEIRKRGRKIPAGRVRRLPGVIIPGVTAIPGHGIDAAGAAQHLSARDADDAAIDIRRWRVVVAPVVVTAQQRGPTTGIIDRANPNVRGTG